MKNTNFFLKFQNSAATIIIEIDINARKKNGLFLQMRRPFFCIKLQLFLSISYGSTEGLTTCVTYVMHYVMYSEFVKILSKRNRFGNFLSLLANLDILDVCNKAVVFFVHALVLNKSL